MKSNDKGHHIWCNSQQGPVAECYYCAPTKDGTSLWEEYPYGDAKTTHELMAKHFPNNIPLSEAVKLEKD